MLVSLFDFLRLRRPPMGRLLFALSQILKKIDDKREPGLRERVEEAAKEARKALALQREWDSMKLDRTQRRGDAVLVDLKFDQAWRALESFLQGHIMPNLEDGISETAQMLKDEIFPRGLGALTKQPFEIQLAESDFILSDLKTRFKREIVLLGLERHLSNIAQLADQLRQELAKRDESLEWEDVLNHRSNALDSYASVIFNILAQHSSTHSDSVKRRSELLHEVLRQNDLLLDFHRRRRTPIDVHPETGELLVSEEWDEALVEEG